MHFPCTTAANAGFPSHQFCHHCIHIRSLGNQMPVATVGRSNVILFRQRLADTGSNRFLTDIHMHVADHNALLKISDSRFFIFTDQMHRPIQLD